MTVAVIFDMDGVLADTEPIYLQIMREMFAQHGAAVSEARLESYVGVTPERFWPEICRDFGLNTPVEELVRAEKEEQLRRIAAMPSIPPAPGAKELVQAARRSGAKLGLASSSSRKLIRLILERTGFSECFQAIVSGQDVANSKPAPDIFLAAATLLKAPPAKCVVIEDANAGVQGAKAAGMKVVGYVNSTSGNQDLSAADIVTTELSAALAERALALLK